MEDETKENVDILNILDKIDEIKAVIAYIQNSISELLRGVVKGDTYISQNAPAGLNIIFEMIEKKIEGLKENLSQILKTTPQSTDSEESED